MPQSFHFLVETTDCLGHRPKIEMTVIASDEREAYEEVAEYFRMHGEIESWKVAKTVEVSTLPADSLFTRDYDEKGAHSYISR